MQGDTINVYMFLQNLNVVFTFGQYASHNGTEIFVCYALDEAGNWMNIWSTVRNIYVKINFKTIGNVIFNNYPHAKRAMI